MPNEQLRFRFNLDKFVNALAYFAANGVPNLTKLKALKLLYLADRDHLLTYGRPITGDRYIAMDLGPVPEGAFQLISRAVEPDEVHDPARRRLLERLKVHKSWLRYPVLRLRRAPDLDVFSESELGVLAAVVKRFGAKPARALVDLTHTHHAYKIVDAGRAPGSSVELPYEYFFADSENQAVLEWTAHQQEDRDFAEALRKAGRSALRARESAAPTR